MPRQARLDTPGTLHHVMGRVIEKVIDLDALAKKIDKREGVEETELKAANRRVEAVGEGRLFCQLAVKQLNGDVRAEIALY